MRGSTQVPAQYGVPRTLARLEALPESEQVVAITLYGLDRERKHKLPDDRLVLH